MMEFSIKSILQEWIKRIWIIIICAVVAAVGMYIYTKSFSNPVYTTTMKITTIEDIRNDEASPTAGNAINNLTLAARRVQLYFELLKTQSFYNAVNERSGLGYNISVGSMLSFREVEDMGFFYVTVSGVNYDHVDKIARSVEDSMKPYLDSITSNVAVKVLEPHHTPYASPIPAKNNAVKGALLGAALAMALFAVIALFDTHIKDEETLVKRYDIPILGSIPDFTSVTVKTKRGGENDG